MTCREAAVLAFIERYRAERGYSPAYQDIADDLGMVKSAVHRLVHQMIDKGILIIRRYPDGRKQVRSTLPAAPVDTIRRALREARRNTAPGFKDGALRRMIDEAEAALEKLT